VEINNYRRSHKPKRGTRSGTSQCDLRGNDISQRHKMSGDKGKLHLRAALRRDTHLRESHKIQRSESRNTIKIGRARGQQKKRFCPRTKHVTNINCCSHNSRAQVEAEDKELSAALRVAARLCDCGALPFATPNTRRTSSSRRQHTRRRRNSVYPTKRRRCHAHHSTHTKS